MGTAKSAAVVHGSLTERAWKVARFEGPVYALAGGPWGVTATVIGPAGPTAHLLDGCTGQQIATIPGPRLERPDGLTGLWTAFVGDTLWMGVADTERSRVFSMTGRNGVWQEASSFDPGTMPMPNGPIFEHPGWSGARDGVVYAVTAAGGWAFSTSTGKLRRLGLTSTLCGAGSSVALGVEELYVWGGQDCSASASRQQTASGEAFSLVRDT